MKREGGGIYKSSTHSSDTSFGLEEKGRYIHLQNVFCIKTISFCGYVFLRRLQDVILRKDGYGMKNWKGFGRKRLFIN